MCPVLSFEKYISKLHPDLDSLWQRPKDTAGPEEIWYCRMVVGERTLGNMMAHMSDEFKLSKRYTNHCLRVTAISVLDQSGVAGRHIIRISGHKNEESLKNYSRKITNAKKRSISETISAAVGVSPPAKKLPSCVTQPQTVTVDVQGHHKVNQAPLDELSDVPEDNNPAVDDKLALTNSQMENALSSLLQAPNFSLSPLLNLVDDSPQDASAVSAVAAVGESSVATGCHQQCIQHNVSQGEATTTHTSTLHLQNLREQLGINFHPNMYNCPVNINFNYNK